MAELVDFSTQLLAHFIDHGLTRKTRKQSPGKANLSGSVQGGFHWNDTTPRLGADSGRSTARSASARSAAAAAAAGRGGGGAGGRARGAGRGAGRNRRPARPRPRARRASGSRPTR